MNEKDIIVIKNPDKEFSKPQKNPLLPKGGSRIILSSRPGSGKGCVVKQIIVYMDPPFERICLLHIDKSTLEWDDCDVEKIDLDDIEHGFFNREISNCLILDEYDFEGCSRQQRGKLDRIFQYTASHYNLTVFCLQQNFCSIPVPIRRSADMWCIWKSCDNQVVRDISLKTGHSFRTLAKLVFSHRWVFGTSIPGSLVVRGTSSNSTCKPILLLPWLKATTLEIQKDALCLVSKLTWPVFVFIVHTPRQWNRSNPRARNS